MKNLKCTYDHEDISSYKEETDQRYFKDEDSELFGTSCASCHVAFECEGNIGTNVVYIPEFSNPTQFCYGWHKLGCKHGYCHACYLIMMNNNDTGRLR